MTQLGGETHSRRSLFISPFAPGVPNSCSAVVGLVRFRIRRNTLGYVTHVRALNLITGHLRSHALCVDVRLSVEQLLDACLYR